MEKAHVLLFARQAPLKLQINFRLEHFLSYIEILISTIATPC